MPSPLEEARSHAEAYSRALAGLRLPRPPRRAVASAARKAAVFQALRLLVETRLRWAGGAVIGVLATSALLVVVLGSAPDGNDPRTASAVQTATLLGMLAGAGVAGLLFPRLILVRWWVQSRRPWLRPVTDAAVFAVQIAAAALCGWYAAGHVVGLPAGVAWGVVTYLGFAGAGAVCRIVTARWWRTRYGDPPWSAVATADVLKVAWLLARDRRAWRRPAARKELADLIHVQTVQTAHRYRQLAYAAGWSAGDRATILSRGCRLQGAFDDYRHALLDVTSQREYDALLDRATSQTAALANKNWDGLPEGGQSRTANLAAGALYSTTLGTLSGLAVNAASEHLPDPFGEARPAWIALLVSVALLGISAWRSAR
ncbi:hypothetical protein [Actinoplanes teichomyceticus]|nr:hypothetical protein [Actinoplanes teichomyceticus]GIF15970.1 hypothetical protein Ate01nite_60020 [Actinoplanes teichomyceticus]